MRVVAGELAVEINATIDRILKPVEPGSVPHVVRGARDGEGVVGRKVGQLQPASVEGFGGNCLAIELGVRYRRADELDERGRARLPAAKGNSGFGTESYVAGREIQPYVVVDVGEELSACLSLLAREVVADVDVFCLAGIAAQQQRC
jgi:hypothetical protein